MTDDKAPPADAVLGHNSQADAVTLAELLERMPTADVLLALMESANSDALKRVDEILTKGAKFLVIENDDQESQATEFMVPIRARWKASEADRVATKTPFDDLAGAAQAFFKRRILDPIGLGTTRADEDFDPVDRDDLGMGPRINMALTHYKRKKVAREKQVRELEAARAREAERVAAEQRREAERKRQVEEDRKRAEARAEAERVRLAEEAKAAAAREAARKAAEEVAAREAEAARKRNAANKAAADKEAEAARARAAEAERLRLAEEAAARKRAEEARAAQDAEDRRLAAEREERDRLAREEENRLAAERAKAEEAAAATTADMSRSRGGKGGVASLKEFINWRDVDREKLAALPATEDGIITGAPSVCALLPYIPDKALDTAIQQYEKANKATVNNGVKNGRQPLHGVVFFIDTKNAGRS